MFRGSLHLLLINPGVVAKYVYYEDGEEPGVKDVEQSGTYFCP